MRTAAIAGIGATEFSKDSGRSELRLAAEAVQAALADARLGPSDVDGMVTFTMDTNAEIAVARELGVPELRFFVQIGYGGGAACGCVQHAAMAMAAFLAEVVFEFVVIGPASLDPGEASAEPNQFAHRLGTFAHDGLDRGAIA